MIKSISVIAEKELHLTGIKKERFVREAEALRANLSLRQKQQKARSKKCTHLK